MDRVRAALVRGASVYAPEPIGVRDVLIVGGRIAAIASNLPAPDAWFDCDTIDGRGLLLFPGLIDAHVHILGGGGEGGPATRAPEISPEALLSGGITSVVGLLGFDGVTRSVSSLLAKARDLRSEGVSAWLYTGSYQVPPRTITGDLERDIVLIHEVVGVGEIAIADQRSSQADPREIVRLAARARIAGLLAGKAGLVHIHLGDAPSGLSRLVDALRDSDLPPGQFYPTHVNRRGPLLRQAAEFSVHGAAIDVTASCTPELGEPEAVPPDEAIAFLLRSGVDPERLTMTSDGNGSLPSFDERGRLVRMEVGSVHILWDKLRRTIRRSGLPPERVLALATSNPARVLHLHGKGRIAPGMDGDLLLVDRDLEIRSVVVGGRVWNGENQDGGGGSPVPDMRAASRPLGQMA